MARLTKEQWEIVRADYEVRGLSNYELANKHGVSETAIRKKAKIEGWFKYKKIEKVNHNDSGFIYVISFNDSSGKKFSKIGIARNIYQRLSTLQTSTPFKLSIEIGIHVENMALIERKLHLHFIRKRLSGEWFLLENKDLKKNCKHYIR